MTKKLKPINEALITMIVNRSCKGCAFRSYPRDGFDSAQEVFAAQRKQVTEDSKNLSDEDFRAKYEQYIY